jgi:hypothetical protein
VTAGLDSVEDFDTADFDHPVSAARIQPCSFGVEDDFPHETNLSTRRKTQASKNMTDLGLSCG